MSRSQFLLPNAECMCVAVCVNEREERGQSKRKGRETICKVMMMILGVQDECESVMRIPISVEK